MSVLWDTPYFLDAGDSVKAIVRAHNARGWSIDSDPSTTFILAQTIPI
jgi:hypothetical protein